MKRRPAIDRYILNEDGEPVPEPDLLAWGRWLETADRQLAEDFVGAVRVSTVFLGIDHRFHGEGPPIVWETMVFGAPEPMVLLGRERMLSPDMGETFDSLGQRRYASRAAALAGHAEALAAVHRLAALLSGPRQRGDDRPAEHAEDDQGGRPEDR